MGHIEHTVTVEESPAAVAGTHTHGANTRKSSHSGNTQLIVGAGAFAFLATLTATLVVHARRNKAQSLVSAAQSQDLPAVDVETVHVWLESARITNGGFST